MKEIIIKIGTNIRKYYIINNLVKVINYNKYKY